MIDEALFESENAQKIIEYVEQKYGDTLEYLWRKFPNNAIWRRKDNRKWYAALLKIPKSKLGLVSNECVEILNVKVDCAEIDFLVDCQKYFAGYHMNKKHWVTICLDGSVDFEELCERIDASYLLAKKRG
ncbi:MmcQ/YjbR family DNA-binding protein [Helicobacter typhlonius]|uniref:MmcQ/YjbR family DNA-binding protein n=1 Tax=Helicobacter typhlonius TaxID=76936 RepID=UPI002FE23E31